MVGSDVAGEIMAGDSEAGEIMAGDSEAGEIMAGDSVAGEIMAGDSVAGEIMAGELSSSSAMITFEVDLSCPSTPADFSTVYFTGSFCNWCDRGYPLLDLDEDGIYTGTFELPFGLYEYKYILDMFRHQEDLLSYSYLGEQSCAPRTDQHSYANRLITLNSDLIMQDIYGHCSSCDDRPSSDLLFTEITFDDPEIQYFVMGFENAIGGIIQHDRVGNENAIGRILKSEAATSTSGALIITQPNQTVGIIPLSEETPWMSVTAYSSHFNTPIRLKVQSSTDPSKFVEVDNYISDRHRWETLYFDFSRPVEGTPALDPNAIYDKISIFFNFGVSGADADERVYYFDDLTFWGERPLTRAPCTAQSCPYTSIEWVNIDQGKFTKGVDQGIDNETPAHLVTIPNLQVMKSEVTIGQYRSCVDAQVCEPLNQNDTGCVWSSTINRYEDHPARCLSRIDLSTFAEWLGDQHSAFADARLMTESEWEFVATSRGVTSPFPWGVDLIGCHLAHYQGCESGPTLPTIPVCTTAGNSIQGLCDLLGNVAEWVADDWPNDYLNTPRDGSPFINTSSDQGTIRGGHFDYPYTPRGSTPGDLSTTMHTASDPRRRVPHVGGRLARFGEVDAPLEWISLPLGTWNNSRVLPFDIMKTEITVGHYRRCMEAGICEDLSSNQLGSCGGLVTLQFNGYRDHHPLRCATLDNILEMTQWLNNQALGYQYRIPSINEWLYANSNATGNETYPWGTQSISCDEANVDMSSSQQGCSLDTEVVCSHPAGDTSQGLCDMIGNVAEHAVSGIRIQSSLKAIGLSYLSVPLSASSFEMHELLQNPPIYHESLGGRLVRISGRAP